MLRVLIADDHAVVRAGVKGLIESRLNWNVVAEAVDGREAIALARDQKPDVSVIDYSMPIMGGVEVTRQIKHDHPNCEVLIYTAYDCQQIFWQLLSVGARGYVLKTDPAKLLLDAVEALALHKPWFTGDAANLLADHFIKTHKLDRDADLLTFRERTVVQMAAEGYTNKQMASLLGISLKTVETHRASVMEKLGLGSVAHLVRYAIRTKLVLDP